MFFKRRSQNVINSQVIQVKASRVSRQVLRDAKRRIRRGEIHDTHSYVNYLGFIDSKFQYLKAQISNTRALRDYDMIRANRIADAREILAFYKSDFADLAKLHKDLQEKAKLAGKERDTKTDAAQIPDMAPLEAELANLTESKASTANTPSSRKVKVSA